jgi:outer membrane protein assembly factor BamB
VSGPGCGRFAACPRDGAIDLFVAVTEDHPGTVEATVDLDGDQLAVPFGPAQIGTDLTVSIPLARYPFPRFSGTVKPRVHARDAFGNEATLDVAEFPVTRLRWATDLRDAAQSALKVTGAAVRPNGDAVVGGSDGKLHLVTSDGMVLLPMGISSFAISSAPSLGASTIWVGSDDGKLYGRVDADIIFGCPASAAVGSMFTPAVRLTPAESAYSGGSVGKLYGANVDRTCFTNTASTAALGASAIIATDKLYVLTSDSTLKRYTSTLGDDAWSVSTTSCADVPAPMTYAAGSIFFACGIAGQKAEIHQVDVSTATNSLLATLSSKPSASAVILGSDLLLGTNDGKLHRLTPPGAGSGAWTDLWSALPALSSSVRGVLVAEQDGDGVVAYAVTGDGQLHALDADGHARWSTTGETPSPLGISPLTFPTIAPATSASQLPTLYVGSDDGHLYAVVVDSALDPSSPWPKSHHDVRNTGNADAPVYP